MKLPFGSTVGDSFEILHSKNHNSMNDPHLQYTKVTPRRRTKNSSSTPAWAKVFSVNLNISTFDRIFAKIEIQGGDMGGVNPVLCGLLDIGYTIFSSASKRVDFKFYNRSKKLSNDQFRLYESINGDVLTLTLYLNTDYNSESYWYHPVFIGGFKKGGINGLLYNSDVSFYDSDEPLVLTANLPAGTNYKNDSIYFYKEMVKSSHNADYAIANNAESVLVFATEEFDNYNTHVTSGNTTTVTVAQGGYYMVKGVATFASNATGIRKIAIYKGSTKVSEKLVQAVNGDVTTVDIVDTFNLNVGDVISLKAYQNSGGTINIVGTQTLFSVTCVSQ